MKTTTNFNQIASASILAATLFVFSAFAPVNAATTNDSYLSDYEVKAATDRLEAFNVNVERTISYKVAEINANEEVSEFEVAFAVERLENINSAIEESLKFTAPVVDEQVTGFDFEIYSATERLENTNNAIEDSIRYVAPSATAF
jgi:hypothetical protein